MVVLGWCWAGEGKVFWARELCRQAGALHVLCCRTFPRPFPSFTLCLSCFGAVHCKLWSDSLTLHYPAALTLWYVHLFHCSCSKCAVCWTCHCSPRGCLWFLLPPCLPCVTAALHSCHLTSGIQPQLLQLSCTTSPGDDCWCQGQVFQACFSPSCDKSEAIWQSINLFFCISVGMGHIPSSCQWAWRCEGDRTDVTKGMLRKMPCFESWHLCVIIFLCEGIRDPLGRVNP